MTIDAFEESLAPLMDDDVSLFGGVAATQQELSDAEREMNCPFHPQHRELLLQYGSFGMQVRDGVFSRGRLHQPIHGYDIEPTLLIPGPREVLQLREMLVVLEYNNLDVNQMPLLFLGSGDLFFSDSNSVISEIGDHRPTLKPCTQDVFELIIHHAKAFRSRVDEKLKRLGKRR